jgi:hypothetical protein
MGLLDNFNLDDPKTMGLLNAGLGIMGQAGDPTRQFSLGQALSGGLNAYTGTIQEAKRQKQLEEALKMRSQQDAMGLEMNRMQLDQNKSNILAKQKAAEFQAQIPQIVQSFGKDYAGMRLAGVPQDLIEFIAKSGDLGMPEVARTIDTEGPNGEKITVSYDKQGRVVGQGVNSYVAPVSTNLGDRVVFNKPMAGQSLPMGRSPDSVASNNITMRGQNMTDARARDAFAFNKQKDLQENGYSTKPLPATALKMQNDAIDAIGTAGGINKMLSGVEKQIADGKVKFGPISNLSNKALNSSGMSTEESRNFASFESTLEKMRNESLRLNSGVQTDGDAQRAWNELFKNITDTDLVKQRLAEIKALNNRAVDLQKLKVDGIRSNYKAEPFDYGKMPDAVPKATMRFNPSIGKLERVE